MNGRAGITLTETVVLAVVVLAVVILAVVLIGNEESQLGGHWANCMSNLSSINKAVIIYKGENDGEWPWLYDTITEWDTTKVGTNRNVSPYGENDDPNNPKRRSITTLMFRLVRMNQSPGMFRCPQDKNSEVDLETKADANDGDVREGEYYWDFSKPENVSFSYQAPRHIAGKGYANGIENSETELIVVADMTPAATNPGWKPADVSKLTGKAIQGQLGSNHGGKQVNVLRVAGYVQPQYRPDVGDSNDNIYTTYGRDFRTRRSATSLDIRQHVRKSDTFLIGPVGRAEPADEP